MDAQRRREAQRLRVLLPGRRLLGRQRVGLFPGRSRPPVRGRRNVQYAHDLAECHVQRRGAPGQRADQTGGVARRRLAQHVRQRAVHRVRRADDRGRSAGVLRQQQHSQGVQEVDEQVVGREHGLQRHDVHAHVPGHAQVSVPRHREPGQRVREAEPEPRRRGRRVGGVRPDGLGQGRYE